MKRPVLFARVLRLLRNLSDAAVSGDRFPVVSRTIRRLLHLKVNETQVLLLSGLVVGVGAGLGAVVFRELISGCTFLFFDVLRPALSRLFGSLRHHCYPGDRRAHFWSPHLRVCT